ncbi:hypothetical protein RRG08_030744 [Elysia crispata]|uniref:BTB domain-containing protein n=1 Tax=Elysia crispata TaxID=231223 RepID=A0AAE0Y5V7_9GAST|nr:hypothetical protein RRG08_030744 [Elysia crispata]
MSGFFRALFSSGMAEAREGKVTLQEISPGVFADVLKWTYQGDFILDRDNMFAVLSAAHLLDIGGLVSECTVFISQNLSVDNCVTAFQACQIYSIGCAFENKVKSFLFNNFDKVCVLTEFCALKKKDIEFLVTSSDLVTRSEDVVIDSILRWARFNATDERQMKATKEVGNNELMRSNGRDVPCGTLELDIHSQIREDNTVKASNVPRKELETPLRDVHSKSNNEEDSEQRVGILADLLGLTRYLLVSGNFYWQSLASDPMLQADQRCRAILKQILHYKTQLDSHQDACLSAACHRLSDKRTHCLLTCSNYRILRIVPGSNSVELSTDYPLDNSSLKGLVFYDNKLYISNERNCVHVFDPEAMKWDELTTVKESNVTAVTMMPVGNELVSVYTDVNQSYNIGSLSLQAHKPTEWKHVGTLSTCLKTLASVTNLGFRLIFFWRHNTQQTFSVECFHMIRGKSFLVPNQLVPTPGLVTFKHFDEAYALQDTGTLWRITALEEEPFIALRYELCLWNDKRAISGAILDQGNLLVFNPKGETYDQAEDTPALNDVFTKFTFLNAPHPNTGFIHAVLPKTFLG